MADETPYVDPNSGAAPQPGGFTHAPVEVPKAEKKAEEKKDEEKKDKEPETPKEEAPKDSSPKK